MQPVAYSVATAAQATGLSQTRIKAAIHSGALRSKRSSVNEDGEPCGKYVIPRQELERFVESLEDA